MTGRECRHEPDVIRAIVEGAWPGAVEEELRTHVHTCAVCAAAIQLATCLAAEREAAYAEARLPSAAIAWWRADQRARQELDRAVGRPIVAVVGVTLAAIGGLIFAVVPAAWTWVHAWAVYVATLFGAVRMPVPAWTSLSGLSGGPSPLALAFWLGVLVWLIVAPLALYFVLTDD